MKPFLFITDFDGTITAQDFFLQILYRYEHDKIFRKDRKKGVEMLCDVLENTSLNEEEFIKEIKYIPMDRTFNSFSRSIEENGGKVLILSAGSKYYIEKKLCFEGVKNFKIFANDGIFKDGHFKFLVNEDERFFCSVYGVDKSKVVSYYKKKYEKIFYAGDSSVDFYAAKLADYIFAKSNLANILRMFKIKFFEFENFEDVRQKTLNLIKS